MKGLLLRILFFCLLTPTLIGQSDLDFDHGSDLLKQAESSFCNGDTIQTIKTLENYIDKFPNLGTTLLISKKLAELYLATDNSQLAISLLTNAIGMKPTEGYLIFNDSCGLFNGLHSESIKADICVALSKVYSLSGDNLTALKFLSLADTKYLPNSGGCANGMEMYRTKLSLDFADYYLQIGDTAKAIDRLIDFFLSDEGYDNIVAERLKSVLLLTYTQEQITDEVNNCINSMQIIHTIDNVDGTEPIAGETIYMILFGRTIQKSAYKDLKFYKSYYAKHKSILTMTSG